MSLISLRESLSRSKAKWKQRLNISSSGVNSPRPSTVNLPPVSAGPLPSTTVLAESTSHPSNSIVPVQAPEPTVSPGAVAIDVPEKEAAAWPVVRSLLTTLESGVDACGPLKAVISGLNKCVDIFETASNGKHEYDQLRVKLEGLLADLAKYTSPPMGLVMTDSVKRLCADITVELKTLEETQGWDTGRRFLDATTRSDEILECYGRIHGHLERLTLNATMDILKVINIQSLETQLARISPSNAGIYNSAESDELKRGICAPGTREQQIDMLLRWARDPDTGRTCWMNGMAGTGKTTIAYTVCSNLEETFELGASFFCSRTIPECRQVKHIIPSIAYQLARFSLPFRCALVNALESDPDAHTRALKIQYQKLIVDPLLVVQESLPTDLIVIIDALDECESVDSVGQILDLLLSATSSLPIRYLLSSRPEPEINKRMMSRMGEQGDTRLVLHDLDSESVRSDIGRYIRYELRHIPLADAQMSRLIDRCGVLFIYASTTCRYIEQEYETDTLDEAVNIVLNSASMSTEPGNKNAIDMLYLTILTAAFDKSEMSRKNRDRMRSILETVICAIKPMTLDALAGLLRLKSRKQVYALLQPLRSVLNIGDATGLVTTLHASFPDFMLSPNRSAAFHCEQATRHTMLAEACLEMIDSIEPGFNICSLESSYLLDTEVENLPQRINQVVSPGLAYACLYWSRHLFLGEYRDSLIELVRNFFLVKLLIWMEILNLSQEMRNGTSIIIEAERWCNASKEISDTHLFVSNSIQKPTVPYGVTKVVRDAWQFVSVFANHVVSQSTPHIYVSMLPFWPASRPISEVYLPRTVGMIQAKGTAIDRRHLALLATWHVASPKSYSMSVSVDSTRLAAATKDGIVVIDTITGESILSLTEADEVLSVAISPDGTKVMFGCRSGTIKHWDSHNGGQVTELLPSQQFDSGISSITVSSNGARVAIGLWSGDIYIHSLQKGGKVLGPLKGLSSYVYSVSFSPDGLYLASGSSHGPVRIWDATRGRTVGNALEGHKGLVRSVSYSPEGSHLASASDDGTIRVWDPQTGQTVLGPIEGHPSQVLSVDFSRNGRFIASGLADGTIRVYDAQTGQTALGPLRGHTGSVYTVIFSSDSTRLFSSSRDGSIRVWNVQDVNAPEVPLPSPSFSSRITAVRYSHSGSHIVSGSDAGTIHIWDVQTGHMVLGPLYGHTDLIGSVDFSPNDAYIASASNDRTLRIWNTSNGNDIHGPIQGHDGSVTCVRFSPHSSVVAAGSFDGTVRIWDIASAQLVMNFLVGKYFRISSIGFSSNGRQLVSGSDNGKLHVLDLEMGATTIRQFKANHDRSRITSVEFSPDGLCILSSSWDRNIRIWNIQQLRQQTPVIGEHHLKHHDGVHSASFSPDGRFIVSSCGDRTVHVWDAHTRELILGPLEGHNGIVRCVQFSPDGSHVASCSDDRTIRFWDVSSCITNTQDSLDQGDGNRDTLTQNIDNTPGSWSLDQNGWVIGRQKRRLTWVPSDLRTCLQRPLNNLSISDEGSFKLEVNGALIGERWTGCYRP